jgi:phosphatidylglycerophosphate synthase
MTDGERWAADELLALRTAGFRPAAWRRFLAASFRRAGVTRAAHGALARQAHAWSAIGLLAGLAAVRAARRVGAPAPRPATWAAWWLSTALMLDWHLGMLESRDGSRHERLRAADALTLARVGLVPFIAATGPARHRAGFTALLAASATTDLLDGALARRTGTTRLGRDLDTVADLLSRSAAVRAARRAGWLTPRAARLTLARQAIPLAVVSATYFGAGRRPTPGAFGDTRWTAPALLGGLALSPTAPRPGNALVRAASLITLTIALAPLPEFVTKRFAERERFRRGAARACCGAAIRRSAVHLG